MMMRILGVCGVAALAGCVASSPAPRAAAPAAADREEFVLESTIAAGSSRYSCTPGSEGGGAAARAAAAHAAFEQELATFSASQTAVAQAALAAGRSGEAVTAEVQTAGDAFAADQRVKLEDQYGCFRAGQV
jgi:hypothetical protein